MSGAATSITAAMATVTMMATALMGGRAVAPDLHEAMTMAKASKVLQAVAQTSTAASMKAVETGAVLRGPVGTRALVSEGWLRAVPKNPAGHGVPAMPVVVTGATGSFVEMRLVNDFDGSLCDAIAQQSGMGGWAPDPQGAGGSKLGCMRARSGSIAFAALS